MLTPVAIACGATVHAGTQDDYSFGAQHGVLVMTNDAESNAVIAYERAMFLRELASAMYAVEGR